MADGLYIYIYIYTHTYTHTHTQKNMHSIVGAIDELSLLLFVLNALYKTDQVKFQTWTNELLKD